MSGILNVLIGSKRLGRLVSGSTTITSGSLSVPGGGSADLKYFGYDLGGSFGSRSPTTLNGYTIAGAYEVITYASTNGTYSTPTQREVFLDLTGGTANLVQGDLFGITCPGGQYLTSGSATFGQISANDGRWRWTVTTGTDASLYFPSGTLTFVA